MTLMYGCLLPATTALACLVPAQANLDAAAITSAALNLASGIVYTVSGEVTGTLLSFTMSDYPRTWIKMHTVCTPVQHVCVVLCGVWTPLYCEPARLPQGSRQCFNAVV